MCARRLHRGQHKAMLARQQQSRRGRHKALHARRQLRKGSTRPCTRSGSHTGALWFLRHAQAPASMDPRIHSRTAQPECVPSLPSLLAAHTCHTFQHTGTRSAASWPARRDAGQQQQAARSETCEGRRRAPLTRAQCPPGAPGAAASSSGAPCAAHAAAAASAAGSAARPPTPPPGPSTGHVHGSPRGSAGHAEPRLRSGCCSATHTAAAALHVRPMLPQQAMWPSQPCFTGIGSGHKRITLYQDHADYWVPALSWARVQPSLMPEPVREVLLPGQCAQARARACLERRHDP